MSINVKDSIVSVAWLRGNLGEENLVIFDARMKPLFPVSDPIQAPGYIPGALRFDFDEVLCDHTTSLPHMMPSAELFTNEMQKLGVNNESTIVVYDDVSIYSSPRAWWMFRAMGHDQVAVLDGGLPEWIQAGYETESTLAAPERRGNFVADPQRGLIVNSKVVLDALADPAFSVIDARSAGRFRGQDPEPRPGLRGGHMPGAVNIPYTDVLEDGRMSSTSRLQKIFEPYIATRMIFSCGSAVTACVVALAADRIGCKDLAVYDGSWTEWGRPASGLPVATE